MKTLDEVIDMHEHCLSELGCDDCPYFEKPDCLVREDALRYLKEYKRVQGRIEKIAVGNIEDTLAKLDNHPLTWDELKQMEGKPVWVEDDLDDPKNITKYWAIFQGVDEAKETEYAVLSMMLYDIADYGTVWQAYRKERG